MLYMIFCDMFITKKNLGTGGDDHCTIRHAMAQYHGFGFFLFILPPSRFSRESNIMDVSLPELPLPARRCAPGYQNVPQCHNAKSPYLLRALFYYFSDATLLLSEAMFTGIKYIPRLIVAE